MSHVRALAPTRVDIAGGTIDLWPIHQLLDHKATVNIGISLWAEVEVQTLDQRGEFQFISDDQQVTWRGSFEEAIAHQRLSLLGLSLKALWHKDLPGLSIRTKARSPAGAGLGGSSTLTIALLGALQEVRASFDKYAKLSEAQLVALAQDVEAKIIHAPTGIQDYWGALRGRINCIHFPPGEVKVKTASADSLQGFAESLIVCYSGQSRASAINNWEIFKRVFDGDAAILARLNEIGALAETCALKVEAGDLQGALTASEDEWRLRCKLWPNIETDQTKKLDQAAKASGAWFSRVCGAGGGGVMGVFAPSEKRASVIDALTKNGGQVLDAHIAPHGLKVEVKS